MQRFERKDAPKQTDRRTMETFSRDQHDALNGVWDQIKLKEAADRLSDEELDEVIDQAEENARSHQDDRWSHGVPGGSAEHWQLTADALKRYRDKRNTKNKHPETKETKEGTVNMAAVAAALHARREANRAIERASNRQGAITDAFNCRSRTTDMGPDTGKRLQALMDADEEYSTLRREAAKLWREAESRTGDLIKANLEILGLRDLPASGTLEVDSFSGERSQAVELPLSKLCALGYNGLAERVGLQPKMLRNFSIVVEKGEDLIGQIDSDGRFNYSAAPNLRTALGWWLATDGGRETLVWANLEEAVTNIHEIIRNGGTGIENFNGPYRKAVQQIFAHENSRFGEVSRQFMDTLWRIATRELGSPNDGYAY